MKKPIVLLSMLLLFSCSKKETTQQTQSASPGKETVFVERPAEQPQETPSSENTLDDYGEDKEPMDDMNAHPTAEVRDLSGNHPLTLQWISWDKPGTVHFRKIGDHKYEISGSQTKGSDYLKIKGVINQLSNEELAFEGTIESYVAADGKCIRTGPQIFLVTQNRKYWRLQDMVECDGLTDYIDIYF